MPPEIGALTVPPIRPISVLPGLRTATVAATSQAGVVTSTSTAASTSVSGPAPQPDPVSLLDPQTGLVVLQFHNAAGKQTESIPTQKQINSYRLHDAPLPGSALPINDGDPATTDSDPATPAADASTAAPSSANVAPAPPLPPTTVTATVTVTVPSVSTQA